MKRILFVDDDASVLAGLRRMFRPQRQEWDMVFAPGGEAAIREVEAAPFDVVVTDMRMPGIDGAALLAHLRQRHPETVRIVLSGHTELSAAFRSVPVAHQFLSKPCEPEVLKAAVDRACDLERRLQDPGLRRLLGEMQALPSPPHVVLALNELLAAPNPSLDGVAKVIAEDPGMSAKLLQLVNSAFFGLPNPVADVRDAVAYLGLNIVHSLAVAVNVFESFRAPSLPAPFCSVESLQHHSLAVAQTARSLVPAAIAQEAFVAGLLHDVGVLVLATSLPEHLATIRTELESTGRCLPEVELDVVGATHADIGAYLLSLWGLPYSAVHAVANHHLAPDLPHRECDISHATFVADALLAEEQTGGMTPEVRPDTLDRTYIDEIGLADAVARFRGYRADAS